MSLTVMMLIVSVTYAALGPAGEGFLQLQKSRDALEASTWAGRQLRMDIGMASASFKTSVTPLETHRDGRGDSYFDELSLLVREAGKPGLTQVYYHIDEERQMLVRESRLLWANDTEEPTRMDVSPAESFQIELMDQQGQWVSQWLSDKGKFQWPRAVRIHLKTAELDRQWDVAIPLGLNTP